MIVQAEVMDQCGDRVLLRTTEVELEGVGLFQADANDCCYRRHDLVMVDTIQNKVIS
jgi:hypothetical protein